MKIERIFLKNFLIIKQANIALDTGMSVITGETGSGKSLFVSAIKLLRGERASHKIVGPWDARSEISAVIDLSRKDDERVINELKSLSIFQDGEFRIIIRRIIGEKSSAFINDTPVALSTLHSLMSPHLEISSQFENRELSKREYQIGILDGESLSKTELPHYQELFREWKARTTEIEKLQIHDDPGKRDYIEFQIEEIDKIAPERGEEKELQERLFLLENGQHIARLKSSLENTLAEAENALSHAQNDAEELQSLTKNDEIFQRVESINIELSDLHRSVSIAASRTEDSEENQDELQNRLDTLNTLMAKHRLRNTDELLDLLDDMNSEIRELYRIPDTIEKLQKEQEITHKELIERATVLHQKRIKVASLLSQTIQNRLIELGMQGVQFLISVLEIEKPDEYGISGVTFLVNTVGGSKLEPISTLSGGELSRLLLVLKLLDDDRGKIILFDEIDSNIGGETATKAALNLRENAKSNQILVVTHLPQTAAKGQTHFVVKKSAVDSSITATISRLDSQERITELARMMGDASLPAHKISAQALLEKKDDTI